jgi:hypothetical protein
MEKIKKLGNDGTPRETGPFLLALHWLDGDFMMVHKVEKKKKRISPLLFI